MALIFTITCTHPDCNERVVQHAKHKGTYDHARGRYAGVKFDHDVTTVKSTLTEANA